MNEIQIKYENEQLVVSSLQVAKDFEKEHKHVMESIVNLISSGVVENSADLFCKSSYIHEQNKQEYPMYLINRDGFSLLAMGFTGKKALEWKMKYIKAFNRMEMELNSPERILARALQIANTTINNLQIEVEEMKPKADYFDALVDRNLLTNLRDTAKELKVRQTDLINYLIEKKYLYRDQKNKLKPYSNYVQKGLFELKEFVSNGFSSNQVLVTPKGRETLRLLLKVSD